MVSRFTIEEHGVMAKYAETSSKRAGKKDLRRANHEANFKGALRDALKALDAASEARPQRSGKEDERSCLGCHVSVVIFKLD